MEVPPFSDFRKNLTLFYTFSEMALSTRGSIGNDQRLLHYTASSPEGPEQIPGEGPGVKTHGSSRNFAFYITQMMPKSHPSFLYSVYKVTGKNTVQKPMKKRQIHFTHENV